MTEIISWNIQCGRGVDDRVDFKRIARVITEMADADIICLQEVARFCPELDNGEGADQVALLQNLFPDHKAFFGPALYRFYPDTPTHREFGNLILSRLPVFQMFNHPLPQPAPEAPCKHMPRQATEIVVNLTDGPLRLTTTHFEFHSANQRRAQAERLRALHQDALENRSYAKMAPNEGPYAAIPRPPRHILCGDFNSLVDDEVYACLSRCFGGIDDQFSDAWRLLHGAAPHASTCGIHDHAQWPEGPHCRDFFFLSREAALIAKAITVDTTTDASDHQPVLLSLSA